MSKYYYFNSYLIEMKIMEMTMKLKKIKELKTNQKIKKNKNIIIFFYLN
jgi:hypothetical protein